MARAASSALPVMGRPFETIKAAPRTSSNVPKVAMNGWTRTTVTRSALQRAHEKARQQSCQPRRGPCRTGAVG